MKFCVNSRVPDEYLSMGDEIMVDYRDRLSIPSLLEKNLGKVTILSCPEKIPSEDWENIRIWNILAKTNFILCCSSIEDCERAKVEGYQFYFGYPIQTYYELDSLLDMGVCYVNIGCPLFFDMNALKKKIGGRAQVRVSPASARVDNLPRVNGVTGSWIRPEDVSLYEGYIDTLEFLDTPLERACAQFRIYKDQQWSGELEDVVTGLNYKGTNRLLSSEMTKRRMNCNQRCLRDGGCHYCFNALDLADKELLLKTIKN